jgi:hypothetical protein
MKKRMILMGAVVALTASYVLAGIHPVKFTGTEYKSGDGKILAVKVSNANLIADCTGTPGASLEYLASANATNDYLVVVDPCGGVICTNATIDLESYDWINVTNGSTVTEVGTVKLDITGGGGGFLLMAVTKVATPTGTNLTIKAEGILDTTSTNPATFSMTVGGVFKPIFGCP